VTELAKGRSLRRSLDVADRDVRETAEGANMLAAALEAQLVQSRAAVDASQAAEHRADTLQVRSAGVCPVHILPTIRVLRAEELCLCAWGQAALEEAKSQLAQFVASTPPPSPGPLRRTVSQDHEVEALRMQCLDLEGELVDTQLECQLAKEASASPPARSPKPLLRCLSENLAVEHPAAEAELLRAQVEGLETQLAETRLRAEAEAAAAEAAESQLEAAESQLLAATRAGDEAEALRAQVEELEAQLTDVSASLEATQRSKCALDEALQVHSFPLALTGALLHRTHAACCSVALLAGG
jgi:DNA repair exonuclease SbcCD ATPase subunit